MFQNHPVTPWPHQRDALVANTVRVSATPPSFLFAYFRWLSCSRCLFPICPPPSKFALCRLQMDTLAAELSELRGEMREETAWKEYFCTFIPVPSFCTLCGSPVRPFSLSLSVQHC